MAQLGCGCSGSTFENSFGSDYTFIALGATMPIFSITSPTNSLPLNNVILFVSATGGTVNVLINSTTISVNSGESRAFHIGTLDKLTLTNAGGTTNTGTYYLSTHNCYSC